MKKIFGIVMLALTVSTMAGCAGRRYSRFDPPPPPPSRREAMVGRSHAGRVWVPGHYRRIGHRTIWVEGHWVVRAR